MKRVTDLLSLCEEELGNRREAENLLMAFFQKGRGWFYDNAQEYVPVDGLDIWISLRRQGVPLDYLVGHVEFAGCSILVEPGVLIPRPETEQLVERVVAHCAASQEIAFWDLCSGTGCIGVAVKKALPHADVHLVDSSPQAVELAAKNARHNSVEVDIRQGDFLSCFGDAPISHVVCNPPYLAAGEPLPSYEPEEALVGGEDGLALYRRLSCELRMQGTLFLEMGHTQAKDVTKLFSVPPWKQGRVERDWAGKERFFVVEQQK